MKNAFGQPQTVVVLGGSSDIARAVTAELCRGRTRHVVLAGRAAPLLDAAAREAVDAGARSTATVLFDATDVTSADRAVAEAFAAAAGPVDLVVLAVGLLGDQAVDERDPARAAEMAIVNYAWPVAALTAVRERLVAQGTGRILVMSSVAAIRVRRENYLYGGAKAGLDRLAEGMADSLIGTGVSLQILRPGFVHSKMTAGLKAAPFATTPEAVAVDVVKGLATTKRVVTSPAILEWVFLALRHLPAAVWRKLSA
jgi:decaprenylphospho-beta-D-erythro-pentofuranosid-2-ulose 2-reductase